MVGLPLDPGAHARLQRPMRQLERARRQRSTITNGEHARLAIGDRDDHRDKFGGGLRGGDRRRLVPCSDLVHAIRCSGEP